MKGNRWGHRDMTMILVAFRHGLRVAELIDLRWDQVEFESARLHVRRAKNGTPSVHPIHGDELRALRRLQREQDPVSPFVFTTERGGPFSVSAFQRLVARAGEAAEPEGVEHLDRAAGDPVRLTDGPSRRSTTRVVMPGKAENCGASSIPAGPVPTMRTSVVSGRAAGRASAPGAAACMSGSPGL